MFTSEHVLDGRTKRFTITRADAGWSVREELDREVVRAVLYTDWHRVERARLVFEIRGRPVVARKP
jgi:hypothetical protein